MTHPPMTEPPEKPEKHLVKVRTEDLKPGMFVVDIGRGWLRHPWKTKRKLITQRHEIAQLIQHNIEVVTVDLALRKKIAFFGEDELEKLVSDAGFKTTRISGDQISLPVFSRLTHKAAEVMPSLAYFLVLECEKP